VNPYLIAGVALVTIATHYAAFSIGGDVAAGKCAAEKLHAEQVAQSVRESIAEAGTAIAGQVNEAVSKIRVNNTTINRAIEREREIHHVLSNPDCAVPVSTVRLRNDARRDPGPDKPAGQRANDAMPAAAPAAGSPAAAGG